MDAQRASGGVHTLLYIDGAANVCHTGAALTDARCGSELTDDGRAAPSLSTTAGAATEGMCRSGAAQ